MSEVQECNSFGMGVEYVLTEVFKSYFAGEMSEEALRWIIYNTLDSFEGRTCTPNIKVAFRYARGCVCGNCLNVVEKGQPLYSVLDLSSDFLLRDRIMQWSTPTLVTDRLCDGCFDKVLTAYCGEEGVGERERKYIKRSVSRRKWKSTGMFGKEYFKKLDPFQYRLKMIQDSKKEKNIDK